MRIFPCPACGSIVYFEQRACMECGTKVHFSRADRTMVPLTDGAWIDDRGDRWHHCENERIGCNWLAASADTLCFSCALTRSVPDDLDERVIRLLAETAEAKRRLVFQLDDLDLPIVSHCQQPDGGLAFDLDASTDDKKVMIGHMDGVITIDITEAQDSHREALRALLDEPYRTMLGHFRHEIGHYYWQALVAQHDVWLQRFRDLFGDERQDYGAALNAHYGDDDDERRQDRATRSKNYISQYAMTHPWEDFAETFAHFLHIADTLQTAAAHGLQLRFPDSWPDKVKVEQTSIPTLAGAPTADAADLLSIWNPLATALNRVNRSMGKHDLYPFTITDQVADKLTFVLELVRHFAGENSVITSPTH